MWRVLHLWVDRASELSNSTRRRGPPTSATPATNRSMNNPRFASIRSMDPPRPGSVMITDHTQHLSKLQRRPVEKRLRRSNERKKVQHPLNPVQEQPEVRLTCSMEPPRASTRSMNNPRFASPVHGATEARASHDHGSLSTFPN